jgi:hypothetical protein
MSPPSSPDLEIESGVTVAARRAFQLTRFYFDLYEKEPPGATEIPYVSESDYHRAAGLLDCVVDRDAIIGILPPYSRDASRFPFAVPEDEPELVLRQRRIVRAMKDLGVDFRASPRFLIVADARRGPFACELAKGFYWEGFQTSISFLNGTGDELRREIADHNPDFVVLTSSRQLRHALEQPRHTVWVVEHCSEPPIDDANHPALIYADGVDLIGSRAAGRYKYAVDAEQLLIEVNPASLLSHVTKLQFTCFPLVRYGLGRRLATAEAPEAIVY